MCKNGLTKPMGNTRKVLALPFTFTFVIALTALSSVAFAQEGTAIFGYYTNANLAGVPDEQLYLVNPGSVGGFSPTGDLCANIYVLQLNDPVECCSCKVTPDGLRTLSVNVDLTSNPIDPMRSPPLHSGIIKIVSSAVLSDGSCSVSLMNPFSEITLPVAATSYAPSGVLGARITHVNAAGAGMYSVSEANFLAGAVAGTELFKLQRLCFYMLSSDFSGLGICSCGTE